MTRPIKLVLFSVLGASVPAMVASDKLNTLTTNMYGEPGGLIDMPTAETFPDARLSTTFSQFSGTTRTNLTFQITPRLTGSFRYTAIDGLVVPSYTLPTYYDRSFDLRYLLLEESGNRPAVSVGLRDFIGTGLYGSEYFVATKTLNPQIRVSAGVGWGRLGSYGSFGSVGSRPTDLLGEGGLPTYDRWFRGPVAAFGGISWTPTDRLTLKLEYSSDAYEPEVGDGLIERKTPINFGVDYQLNKTVSFGAYALGGTEFGARFTFALDPKSGAAPSGLESAPMPVKPRPTGSAADLGWTNVPTAQSDVRTAIATGLKREGMVLEAMQLSGTGIHILIRNQRYDIEAQALGRAARVLTRTLPPSVENITISLSYTGIPTGSVSMTRRDLERLENAPAQDMLARIQFGSGLAATQAGQALSISDDTYPKFLWSFNPYVKLSVFDPESPVRAGLGVRLTGDYHLGPGWVVSGSLSSNILGNLDSIRRVRPPSATVPVVRSDYGKYERTTDARIEHLTVSKYARLGEDWYARATVGFLETMYAGVSGEVLWKPHDSRLAIGAELNHVTKRDYDGKFTLQDYDVTMGHVSAYYDLGNGFHTQVDVGRYLAGDYGATIALDREFANGWRIGAYATKTDLSTREFGEGSFDKGIRFSIPLSWSTGKPSRSKSEIEIKPLTRDGGAKLSVNGRLYEAVRDSHQPQIAKTWGKFWR